MIIRKNIVNVLLLVALLAILAGCRSKENMALIKHYGQQKYDEMTTPCTDEAQLKVANDIVGQAKRVLSYTGPEENRPRVFGALSQYVYKNAEAEKSDIDMQVITTKQGKTAGYMWVKYSALYYDQNGELIHGVNDTYSRWEMEKENGVWTVTGIDEMG